jgi:hypothetical protein
MSDETPAGELPAKGGTSSSERTDTRTPDGSGTTLTIGEAVERFQVSHVTLRRKIEANLVAGAHKVPGPKGEQWRLPVASLEALGYPLRTNANATEVAASNVATIAAEVDELVAQAAEASVLRDELEALRAEVKRDQADLRTLLAEKLGESQRALMAAESDRTDARAEAAAATTRAEMLAAELERERERVTTTEAQLAEAQRRRGWFRRKG